MTDIFGKTPCDYQHLRDAYEKSPECLSEYLQSSAHKHGNKPHNFNFNHSLLENASVQDTIVQDTVRLMNENRQALQDVVDDVLYEKRYADYLPMIKIDEGAETWKYRVVHEVRQAVYLGKEGTTVPDAIGRMESVPYNIYNHKDVDRRICARDWLKKSNSDDITIDDEHLQLAARRVLRHIEAMLFKGEKGNGEKGFVNLPASITAPIDATDVKIVDTGTDNYFSITTNGHEIVNNINKMNEWILQFINDAKTITRNEINGDVTVYLPDIKYSQMEDHWIKWAGKPGTWTGIPVTLRPMPELNGASTTEGRTDRAIIALNNKDIMEWAMSIPPRVIDVTYRGPYISATIEYAFSALQVKQPAGIRYIDGV